MPCRRLKVELGSLAEANSAEVVRMRLLGENRKNREAQEAVMRRNPILVYAEKLAASDESAWKDNLECMGNTPDIPRLFRHAGKVRCWLCASHRYWMNRTCMSAASALTLKWPSLDYNKAG